MSNIVSQKKKSARKVAHLNEMKKIPLIKKNPLTNYSSNSPWQFSSVLGLLLMLHAPEEWQPVCISYLQSALRHDYAMFMDSAQQRTK